MLEEPYDVFVEDFCPELCEDIVEDAAINSACFEAQEALAEYDSYPDQYPDLDIETLRKSVDEMERVVAHFDLIGGGVLIRDRERTAMRVAVDYTAFTLDGMTYLARS